MKSVESKTAIATRHGKTAGGGPKPQRSSVVDTTSIVTYDRSVADIAATIAQDRDSLRGAIALAAYYRSQQRGFAPGYELEDWLAAEAEVEGQKVL